MRRADAPLLLLFALPLCNAIPSLDSGNTIQPNERVAEQFAKQKTDSCWDRDATTYDKLSKPAISKGLEALDLSQLAYTLEGGESCNLDICSRLSGIVKVKEGSAFGFTRSRRSHLNPVN